MSLHHLHEELKGAKRAMVDAEATLQRLHGCIEMGEQAERRGVAAMLSDISCDNVIEVNHLIARGAIAKRALPRAEEDIAEARADIQRIAGEVAEAAKQQVIRHASVLVSDYNEKLAAVHQAYIRVCAARSQLFGDAVSPPITAPTFRLVHGADVGIGHYGPTNNLGDPHHLAIEIGEKLQAAIDALIATPDASMPELIGDE